MLNLIALSFFVGGILCILAGIIMIVVKTGKSTTATVTHSSSQDGGNYVTPVTYDIKDVTTCDVVIDTLVAYNAGDHVDVYYNADSPCDKPSLASSSFGNKIGPWVISAGAGIMAIGICVFVFSKK